MVLLIKFLTPSTETQKNVHLHNPVYVPYYLNLYITYMDLYSNVKKTQNFRKIVKAKKLHYLAPK